MCNYEEVTKRDINLGVGEMKEVSFDKKDEIEEIKVGSKWKLASFDELPEYMKDNEYILRYYRAEWPLKQAQLSLFQWHNETINIWTHLLGFMLFLGLTVLHLGKVPTLADLLDHQTRSSLSSNANASHNHHGLYLETKDMALDLDSQRTHKAETWPLYVFLSASMFCLLSSSICHLFTCHSNKLNLLLLRIDYSGIAVMIVGSFFPPIYYIFQCDPHWQLVYLAGISIMGIVTLIILFTPALSTSKFRAVRAMLFAAMGFSGIVPAVHALVVNWGEPLRNMTLAYESGMALSYMIGTIFYVSRVPERWSPGSFDLAGHSHQLFHFFVILGALAHYAATLVFLDWRDRVSCHGHF